MNIQDGCDGSLEEPWWRWGEWLEAEQISKVHGQDLLTDWMEVQGKRKLQTMSQSFSWESQFECGFPFL